MLYTDFTPLPDKTEREIGARYVEEVGDLVRWVLLESVRVLVRQDSNASAASGH